MHRVVKYLYVHDRDILPLYIVKRFYQNNVTIMDSTEIDTIVYNIQYIYMVYSILEEESINWKKS